MVVELGEVPNRFKKGGGGVGGFLAGYLSIYVVKGCPIRRAKEWLGKHILGLPYGRAGCIFGQNPRISAARVVVIHAGDRLLVFDPQQ